MKRRITMGFGFLGFFAKNAAEKTLDGTINLLVSFDPDGATEAELEQISASLHELSVKCEEQRRKMSKEVGEAEQAKDAYNKMVDLAEKWEAELSMLEGEDKEKMEGNLKKLYTKIESEQIRVEKEVEEAKYATELFDRLDEAVKNTATKLKNRKSESQIMKDKLELAKMKVESAKQKQETAKVIAGLSDANSTMDVAKNAMNKQISEMEAEAAGLDRQADLLSAGSKEDDFIKQALAGMDEKKEEPVGNRSASFKRF